MEFKDKLKHMRMEKGVSQQALADAIYVSRSAVAKWENGLGYPNELSLVALAEYFGVDRTTFETEKIEEVLIEKNKKIRNLKTILSPIAVFFLVLVAIALPLLLGSGNYGLTSEMAAGTFADNECIRLKDYDIYWYTVMSEEKYACIDGFRPVKKNFYGYTVSETDYLYRELYCNGEKVGIIYSIKVDRGYYNIIKKNWSSFPIEMLEIDTVVIDEVSYEVRLNSFFITSQIVNDFKIGEKLFIIEN